MKISLVIIALIVAVVTMVRITYLIKVEHKSNKRRLARVRRNDPFLGHVKANRSMTRSGDAVVYITDEDNGGYYRYDKGSEQRQIRVNDVWVDDLNVHLQ